MTSSPDHADSTAQSPARLYTNVALTAIAVLVAMMVVERPPAPANAGDPPPNLVNPVEQRREMIAELHQANARLARIEALLDESAAAEGVE